MLSRQRAAIFNTVAIAGETLPFAAIVSSVIDFFENFRIEIAAPSIASGGMMMLTRLPSGRRASTSGLEFVDAAADAGHDLAADVDQVLIVAERDIAQFELAAAFDVNLLRAVDHDVGDALVREQRLERPEPEHVRDQRFDEFALLEVVQLYSALGQQFLDPAGKLRFEGGPRHFGRHRDVHVFKDQRLDLQLGGLHSRPVRPASRFPVALARCREPQHDVGDEIASCRGTGVDGMPDPVSLHRRLDHIGQVAAAQQRAALRTDLRLKARGQFVARAGQPVLDRQGFRFGWRGAAGFGSGCFWRGSPLPSRAA